MYKLYCYVLYKRSGDCLWYESKEKFGYSKQYLLGILYRQVWSKSVIWCLIIIDNYDSAWLSIINIHADNVRFMSYFYPPVWKSLSRKCTWPKVLRQIQIIWCKQLFLERSRNLSREELESLIYKRCETRAHKVGNSTWSNFVFTAVGHVCFACTPTQKR